jgi:hypothetical protein
MKTLLTAFSLLVLVVSCSNSNPKESPQEQEEAHKEYQKQKDSRENFREIRNEQKDSASRPNR